MTLKKYVLTYTGVKTIVNNCAVRCEPRDGFGARINNIVYNAMRSLKVPFVQFATSYEDLPLPGTPNQFYLVAKHPDTHPEDYVVYTYDANENKYVQFGRSIFKHEVEPDQVLNAESTRSISSAGVLEGLRGKYDAANVVDAVEEDVNEAVTSNAVSVAIVPKLDNADVALINKYQLRSTFFTEFANGCYLSLTLKFYPKDFNVTAGVYPGISELTMTPINTPSFSLYDTYSENAEVINVGKRHTYKNLTCSANSTACHFNVSVLPHGNIAHHRTIFNLVGSYGYGFEGFKDPLEIKIVSTDKIPLEALMDAHLTMRSTIIKAVENTAAYITENELPVGGNPNPLPKVYVTVRVSGDGINWSLWRNDQKEYTNNPDTRLFNIPLFE